MTVLADSTDSDGDLTTAESKIGRPRSNAELEAAAKAAYEKWGGLDSLKAGLANHDWSKF